MESGHILAQLHPPLPAEAVDLLASGGSTRIERIVSHGHCSPPGFWYDQSENEWVLLVQGEAVLHFEADDRRLHLAAGSYVHIVAHERHRLEWTAAGTDTVWLAVFY